MGWRSPIIGRTEAGAVAEDSGRAESVGVRGYGGSLLFVPLLSM